MMKRHIRDCHSSHEDKKFKCEICGTFATNAEDRLKVSMTSHLTHDVAHSTRHSFRPKTNDQPFKKFLSLAFR